MSFAFRDVIFLVCILVSTLATLNALPTEIRHECQGNALCHIKPDGYPQDEIDNMALKHFPQLPRMKRDAPQETWVPDNSTTNGNCAVQTTVCYHKSCLNSVKENMPLYTVRRKGSLPDVIVQSKWFKQTITEVKCANDGETSGCFAAYALKPMRTKCETKYMQFDLMAYDLLEKKLKQSPIKIGVDCACVLAEP